MHPYLGPTVRVKRVVIYVGDDSIYNPEQMESIVYLCREGNIHIANDRNYDLRVVLAKDFQSILNSPIILPCQRLQILTARFSFKDYNVLYRVGHKF